MHIDQSLAEPLASVLPRDDSPITLAKPVRRIPVLNPDRVKIMDDDQYDDERAIPHAVMAELDADDVEWVEAHGLMNLPHSREGAAFLRLASDVFLIPVRGGQLLHNDRHLSYDEHSIREGFSEHTWNFVIADAPGQKLVIANGNRMFEHFDLDAGSFIYFNTMNEHMITRKSPTETLVILQVDGFGPDDSAAALARLAEVIAGRPAMAQI